MDVDGSERTRPFPFARIRPFQGEAARTIWTAMDEGARLLLSAPTGIGKTAAATYGACCHQQNTGHKLFYVTARTTHQLMVMETYERMRGVGWDLRVIRLAAKGRICPETDGICPSCPRMVAYRRQGSSAACARLADRAIIHPRDILGAAEACGRICPFELSLDVSGSCSVVVCDYNYIFHPTCFLQRYFSGHYDNAVLVADEVHNLRDRAMSAFSPTISRKLVDEAVARCRDREGAAFATLGDAWCDIGRVLDDVYLDPERWYRPEDAFLVELPTERFHLAAVGVLEAMEEYFAMSRKERLGGELRDHLAEAAATLQYMDVVLELADDEFAHIYRREEREFQVACLDPSRVLARRLAGFHAVVGMSATLEPLRFFRRVLGFPHDCRTLNLPSPFPTENRLVRVVRDCSTRYRDRPRSADRVAEVIAATARGARGNVVAFFPSFAYLELVASNLVLPPGRALLKQRRGMADRERTALLDRMRRERDILLLAVLGGSLSEGIDLPGKALAACVVVSPALPKLTLVQELVRRHFERTEGFGFAYAYAYPGMNKVVQAAGRVIRTPQDVGVVVLAAERFGQPFYLGMMPHNWFDARPEELCSVDPVGDIAAFWEEKERTVRRAKDESPVLGIDVCPGAPDPTRPSTCEAGFYSSIR